MNRQKIRIALFGGTFDPIHLGHLAIAQAAYEQLRLDKVIFIPSHWPPHKSKKCTSAEHRFAMIKLAIRGKKFFEASDVEMKRGGRSYSIDTAQYFDAKYKGAAKLFFLIGGDTPSQLSTWKAVNEIASIVQFVAVNRPGAAVQKGTISCQSIETPGVDLSSTQIRSILAKNRSIEYYVPHKVGQYIHQNKLYVRKS